MCEDLGAEKGGGISKIKKIHIPFPKLTRHKGLEADQRMRRNI